MSFSFYYYCKNCLKAYRECETSPRRVVSFHISTPLRSMVINYSFGFSKLIIELIRNDEWWILIVATLVFPSSNNFFYFLVCKIEHSNDQGHNVIKSFFSEEAVLYSPDIDRLSFGWIESKRHFEVNWPFYIILLILSSVISFLILLSDW